MKKIRLDLDSLSVESFDTAASAEASGTVVGHADPDTKKCEDSGETLCFACLDPSEGAVCTLHIDCEPVPSEVGWSCSPSDCGTCVPDC